METGIHHSRMIQETFLTERKGTKIKIICSNSELLQRIDDKYRGGGEGEGEGEGNCAERKTWLNKFITKYRYV